MSCLFFEAFLFQQQDMAEALWYKTKTTNTEKQSPSYRYRSELKTILGPARDGSYKLAIIYYQIPVWIATKSDKRSQNWGAHMYNWLLKLFIPKSSQIH